MKITEHLKKISFREGLFLIVMLTVIVWQIAIGDTPLPKYIVPYAMPDHSVRATHIFDGRVFDKVDYGSIIMKR